MARDRLVQPTGKYRFIRHMEYPKFQTRIFGRMESAPSLLLEDGRSQTSGEGYNPTSVFLLFYGLALVSHYGEMLINF